MRTSLAKRIEAIIVTQERAALVDWPKTDREKIPMTGPITRNVVPKIHILFLQMEVVRASFSIYAFLFKE